MVQLSHPCRPPHTNMPRGRPPGSKNKQTLTDATKSHGKKIAVAKATDDALLSSESVKSKLDYISILQFQYSSNFLFFVGSLPRDVGFPHSESEHTPSHARTTTTHPRSQHDRLHHRNRRGRGRQVPRRLRRGFRRQQPRRDLGWHVRREGRC